KKNTSEVAKTQNALLIDEEALRNSGYTREKEYEEKLKKQTAELIEKEYLISQRETAPAGSTSSTPEAPPLSPSLVPPPLTTATAVSSVSPALPQVVSTSTTLTTLPPTPTLTPIPTTGVPQDSVSTMIRRFSTASVSQTSSPRTPRAPRASISLP